MSIFHSRNMVVMMDGYLLKEQIGQNLEVYVDGIIIKSKEEDDFIRDIKEVFEQLRMYDIRLNPDKCVFRVKA